jgi:outer membrane protein OmpA-like peptidoglycan-associated protein
MFVVLVAATGFLMTACATPPVNPETEPQISVEMAGEVFTLDPDNPDADQPVATIAIKHPVAIKDWVIQVQLRRTGQGGQQGDRPAGQGGQRQAGQAGERPAGQEGQAERPARQSRGPFYEQTGKGTPPKEWKWNGKSSRPPRQEGGAPETVQSATDYQLILTVNDIFDNSATYEGVISVDVLVRREGDNYRIIVPSIVFPPNSSNFALLSEQEMRANARVLRLIGNALNKFPAYEVEVEGHSNPTTPPDTPARTNEETRELKPISDARAKAVVDYLVENQNVTRSRLKSSGIGGARTVVDYDDADENWKNRRVEFILHK